MGELLFLGSGVSREKGRARGKVKAGGGGFTKERDARRVGEMQSFAVFSKVLGAAH